MRESICILSDLFPKLENILKKIVLWQFYEVLRTCKYARQIFYLTFYLQRKFSLSHKMNKRENYFCGIAGLQKNI